MINLDKFNGSCSTLSKIYGEIYVPNKTEVVNLNVFNLTSKK